MDIKEVKELVYKWCNGASVHGVRKTWLGKTIPCRYVPDKLKVGMKDGSEWIFNQDDEESFYVDENARVIRAGLPKYGDMLVVIDTEAITDITITYKQDIVLYVSGKPEPL